MTTAIEIKDLTKDFSLRNTRSLKELAIWTMRGRGKELRSNFRALDAINITVAEGETVAMLGYNGSGKSTTLKLISGVYLPDGGTVQVRGRVAGLIEVGAGFHPDLTGRENVYLNGAILGMTQEQIEDRYDDIVAFSEIEEFIETEVKFYSSGMFLRLAFAVAVHSDPDVFLIDEILSVGDEPFRRKCLDRIRELKENGHTLVIVTHDLEMVQTVVERGIVLRKGKIIFDGPIDQAVEELRASR
ncbi:MAG TPA: ABC transporter ATP-binding protein [Marmoricola sp.]|nr:ABC transporter ATP-binding protein [Marmoricola sp.]